jgi:hypothetical protein
VDAAQQRHLEQLAVQHALLEMGDSEGRNQRELWQALSKQCERAARGDQDNDGMNYLTVRF